MKGTWGEPTRWPKLGRSCSLLPPSPTCPLWPHDTRVRFPLCCSDTLSTHSSAPPTNFLLSVLTNTLGIPTNPKHSFWFFPVYLVAAIVIIVDDDYHHWFVKSTKSPMLGTLPTLLLRSSVKKPVMSRVIKEKLVCVFWLIDNVPRHKQSKAKHTKHCTTLDKTRRESYLSTRKGTTKCEKKSEKIKEVLSRQIKNQDPDVACPGVQLMADGAHYHKSPLPP